VLLATALLPSVTAAAAEPPGARIPLQELDVVARRGNGVWSALFADASPNDKRFSHVGLLIATAEGWQVLHAEADDATGEGAVGFTGWANFRRESTLIAVYRPQLADPATAARVKRAALSMRGLPFDLDFDLDSTDRVYCTELIARAFFEGAGLLVAPGRLRVGGRAVLTIEDLLRVDWLQPVEPAAIAADP
jgi:hypothetical protein